MKLNRLTLAAILCLLSLDASAQTVLPPKGSYKHHKNIESEYDKFKNQTTVRLSTLHPLPPIGRATLDIEAGFRYSGKTPQPPAVVWLLFSTSSREWELLKSHRLLAIADGERLDLGEVESVDSSVSLSNSRYSRSSLRETTTAYIPLTTFLKIIKAKSVEMQLGSIEFKLADDHLEALRDFASRMSPE